MADEEYVHQPYPKWLYGPNNLTVLVESQEEHDALNGDWYDSPAAVPQHEAPEQALPTSGAEEAGMPSPPSDLPPVEGEAEASAAADEDVSPSPRRRH